jgi:hypothetical protein
MDHRMEVNDVTSGGSNKYLPKPQRTDIYSDGHPASHPMCIKEPFEWVEAVQA